MNHLNIRCPKLPLVLLNEITRLLIPFHSINHTIWGSQCQLNGHGTGTCSHIIDHGIFFQMQFCYGKTSDLTLGHRRFAPQEFFILHAGADSLEGVGVFNESHTKVIVTSLFQFFRRSSGNLFLRVAKSLSDIKGHIRETIFLQFFTQSFHTSMSTQKRKGLLMGFHSPYKIRTPSMGTLKTYIFPGGFQLSAEIYHGRNTAQTFHFIILRIQHLIKLLCPTVKSNISGQQNHRTSIFRMKLKIIGDLPGLIGCKLLFAFIKGRICALRLYSVQHPSGSDKQICFPDLFCCFHRHSFCSAHTDANKSHLTTDT